MDTLTVLCIVSVALTGLTAGSGVLPNGPLMAAVGGSVRFNTTVTPTAQPFPVVTWTLIKESEEIPIITARTKNITDSRFEGRITLFIQTGSLELTQLALNDSGEYRVLIITDDDKQISGTTSLQTLVPVSNATLKVNSTELVEFNSTVRLSCSSFGSFINFQWLNGSAVISAGDTVQLTDDGATLTLTPVTRYDHGLFKCRVSNAISEVTSEPVHLSVSFGPDDTYLQVSPLEEYIAEGSNINLSCFSASRPSAIYTWFLDGKDLSKFGSNLLLMNIQQSQSGNYSCLAFNGNTMRHKISQPSSVNVLKRISNTSITPSTTHPTEGRMLNLTCDAAGSVFFREWTKNGLVLVPDDHITLHDKDAVLSFHTVNRSDSAPYSCRVSNPINTEEITYNILVNYGPDSVQIMGPSQINVKQTLTLTCSAESVPFATFTWTSLNHTKLYNSSTFVKSNINSSDSGSYVCSASNNITGKTISAVHILTVLDEPVSPCSGGCIAGIVVACFVVFGAACGGGYYIYHNRKQLKNHPGENTSTRSDFAAGGKGQDNTAEIKNQEMNYAQLGPFYSKDSGKVQLKVQDNHTEYAEVRVRNGPPSYEDHVQRMTRQAPQPLEANGAQVSGQVHSN
ncbi:carcinoembryonic antigen-related cell adhesion molecule 5-like [Corythoichthys intestinalis]|uniref:carcinoembryonic antigen-related cell adhesion molecule 5-like n=1 Tax=Corythoichthys intestinalis TaxID=161448 RepID=UPI0025A5CD2D|nr:carcinoembryonic antigen-related cell adhesion molecule 5-like [Corythoichthys intestinalis]